ncbi:MAG: hypothetical protein FJY86_04535 [Candidatus Diapherotrites archaeon]|uniref:Uncharacterized protein n=1 Tax=Candidatus Iainarchaeum sp. TaxID=3101447 RepID=A0A8T4C8M9_9ARCH|nr:hypothetical protein [Candidatus Diapherotrites archaeon]
MVFRNVKRIMRSVTKRVLDVEDNRTPQEQMKLLNNFLSRHKFELNTSSIQDLVQSMKKKHLVDSICICSPNGSIVISTDENDFSEAIIGSAMFNYIRTELPESETILVKDKENWFMIFPYNGKIYIIRAASDLTRIELQILAKEIESFLKGHGD